LTYFFKKRRKVTAFFSNMQEKNTFFAQKKTKYVLQHKNSAIAINIKEKTKTAHIAASRWM